MKSHIATTLGLLLAGTLAAQASVLTFDSQASFDDHFTVNNGPFTYSSQYDGILLNTYATRMALLGNNSYNPGKFTTETVSITYTQETYSPVPSIGLVVRVGDQTTTGTKTGLVGLAYVNSSSQVRLRIGHGTVYAGMTFQYDIVTSGLSIAADTTFDLSFLQRNTVVGGIEQAEVRLVLSDATNGTIFADSNWFTHSAYSAYTDEGNVGMRIFPGLSANTATPVTIHTFTPYPIPEPSTYALLGGALALGGLAYRRQQAARM